MKEALASDFPVAFLLPLQQKWRERIGKEAARRKWLAKREAIEPQISVLNERIFGRDAPQSQPPLMPEQTQFFKSRLAEEVRRLFWPPPPEASEELWFDLRDHEVKAIETQFASAAQFSGQTVRELTDAKTRADAVRGRVKEKLNTMGDSDATQTIQTEMNSVREQVGAVKAKLEEVQRDIEHENKVLQEIEGEITILDRECEKSGRGRQKEEVSKQYERAIEEYIGKAASQKAEEVEVGLNDLFMSMANCRDFIRQVRLNPHSYELQVYDTNGRERPIEAALSAGQAQVLAMSFVAALAKASGRILPFIIDTPLGRLDVNHRRDVTKEFFMKCGPQAILLSTPTEINNCVYDEVELDLLDMLLPKLARAYTLVQTGPEETVLEESYFGNQLG